MPPGKLATVFADRFVLQELPEDHSPNKAIDIFLSSAAKEYRDRMIGVILSGSGSDGVRGCQDIYEAGGEVLVQNPHQAEFSSMPESVIQTGFYTRALDAEDMFPSIADIIEVGPETQTSGKLLESLQNRLPDFFKVFSEHYGLQLKDYKQATLCRRLAKKMTASHISSLEDYLERLQGDPSFRQSVFDEIMISVTKFFRDDDFFASLQKGLESTAISEGGRVPRLVLWLLSWRRGLLAAHSCARGF